MIQKLRMRSIPVISVKIECKNSQNWRVRSLKAQNGLMNICQENLMRCGSQTGGPRAIFMVMERNYDEIISEMLRQIDRHNEQLDRHTAELIKQSEKSDAFWAEQRRINADHLSQLKELRESAKEQTAVM